MELTKEDITALRMSEDIVLRTRFNGGENESFLEALIRTDKPTARVFALFTHDGYTWRRNVQIGTSRAQNYGGGEFKSCVTSIGRYRDGLTETVLGVLRAGDNVGLRWVLGNDNETLKQNGLTADECYVVVERKGKRVATFMVDYRVCPVGSSARFAQRL